MTQQQTLKARTTLGPFWLAQSWIPQTSPKFQAPDFERGIATARHALNGIMGKRSVFEADVKAAHTGPHAKRQRTDSPYNHEAHLVAAADEEVNSARQLQQELVFEQGSASSLRNGRLGTHPAQA